MRPTLIWQGSPNCTFLLSSGLNIRRLDAVLVCHSFSLAVGLIAIVDLRLYCGIWWTMPLSYLEFCRWVGMTIAEVDDIHLPFWSNQEV